MEITPEYSSESDIIPSENNTLRFLLKEGYHDVNIPNSIDFFKSGKPLNEYLKQQILLHFNGELNILFLEEKDEFRPTNYLKNPRHLKTFIVEDSIKGQHTFVFDVANCLI